MWGKISLLTIFLTLMINFSSFGQNIINIYSIQILSTKNINYAKNEFKKVSKLPFTRIEKINSYYVLRVGEARSKKKLKSLLKKIRKVYKDASICIADIISDRIIISNFQNIQKKKKATRKEEFEIVQNPKDIFHLIPDINFEKKQNKKEQKQRERVKIQPYAILNLEINEVNKDAIRKQLKKHRHTLPYRDKVLAEDITGEANEALNSAYKNLERSKDDYLAYKQFKDLYEKYSNRFQSKINYEYFEDVSRFYTQAQLKEYIGNNIYLYLNNENYITTSYKNRNYKYLPKFDSLFTLGLKKLFDSKYLLIRLGIRKSLETLPVLSMDYNFKNKYLDSTLSLGVNQRAEESNYSFYGASKTNIKYSADIPINSKNVISNNISINKYYSQDFKDLGNGLNIESRYLHKYRVGYPDFSTYTSISGGFYNEKSNKIGSINKILVTPNIRILPNNFIEACAGFSFGLNYINTYEKQLRPFLDANTCYNTAYGIGYSVFSGLGGQMFDNDNFSLGIYMGKGLFTSPYTIFKLQLYYRKWF